VGNSRQRKEYDIDIKMVLVNQPGVVRINTDSVRERDFNSEVLMEMGLGKQGLVVKTE
jgi:hypothetical protein